MHLQQILAGFPLLGPTAFVLCTTARGGGSQRGGGGPGGGGTRGGGLWGGESSWGWKGFGEEDNVSDRATPEDPRGGAQLSGGGGGAGVQ